MNLSGKRCKNARHRSHALTPMVGPEKAVTRSCYQLSAVALCPVPSRLPADPVTVPNICLVNSLSAQAKPENPSWEKAACRDPHQGLCRRPQKPDGKRRRLATPLPDRRCSRLDPNFPLGRGHGEVGSSPKSWLSEAVSLRTNCFSSPSPICLSFSSVNKCFGDG